MPKQNAVKGLYHYDVEFANKVREECEKACRHYIHQLAAKDQQLLRYLVEEELSGRGEGINQNSVLSGCFRDVGSESNVRQHKMALSQKQAEYNDDPDIRHSVFIHIPEGFRVWFSRTRSGPAVLPTKLTETPIETKVKQFFGDAAFAVTDTEPPGAIIVQSDSVDGLFGHLPSKIMPTSRIFKARNWVNHWDTKAAHELSAAFQKAGVKAPEILLRMRNDTRSLNSSVPVISLGLGFTPRTIRAFANCSSWACEKTWRTDCGDALSIHQDLLSELDLERVQEKPELTKAEQEAVLPPGIAPSPYQADFRRLLPSDWSEQYTADWATTDGKAVRDYAIILRHTEFHVEQKQQLRRVLLVAAGFTEFGTFAAGHYLANNWENKLWSDHVDGKFNVEGSLGDFLLIIEGPSEFDHLSDWSEICAITPAKLNAKHWFRSKDGHWVRRLP